MNLLFKPENDTEKRIVSDKKILKGYQFGKVRSGHPEGNVGVHVSNILEFIDKQNWSEYRERLRTIAMVHDSFKYLQFAGGLDHSIYAAQYYSQLALGKEVERLDINQFNDMAQESLFLLTNPEQEEVRRVILHHDAGWRFYKHEKRGRGFSEREFKGIFESVNLELMIRFNYVDSCQRELDTVLWLENAVRERGLKNQPGRIYEQLVR